MTTMTPAVQPSEQTTVVWLDPQTLAAAEGNIRADIGEIAELVASIKAYGVLEPLVVIPAGDGYRLIAGKRRAAAAVEAGASLVPCWERADLAGATSEVAAQLIENEHRKMLNVAEPSGIAFDATFRSPAGSLCLVGFRQRTGRVGLRVGTVALGR